MNAPSGVRIEDIWIQQDNMGRGTGVLITDDASNITLNQVRISGWEIGVDIGGEVCEMVLTVAVWSLHCA